MWAEAASQVAQAAASEPSTSLIVTVSTAIGGTAAVIYAIWDKFKKNSVEQAGQNLDITALGAGSQMITNLQSDIQRLRDTQAANEAKWQSDMQRLQDRLDAMAKQVEESMVARRALEEIAARLRLQLIRNNITPDS